MKLYVASSWRNEYVDTAVLCLRAAGFDVYDFKNPESHFAWSQIDPNWQSWSHEDYVRALHHPLAKGGYMSDMAALTAARAVVLVLPSGRSSHIEAGWAKAAGKLVYVWAPPPLDLNVRYEPELMYSLFDGLEASLQTIIDQLTIVRRQIGELPARAGCDE